MRRRFSVSQDLDDIFVENEGEDTEQHSDLDEQVSEEEDTDTSDESDEEVTGAEAAPTERFKSKNGKICWSSVPPYVHGRAAAANAIKMTLSTKFTFPDTTTVVSYCKKNNQKTGM